MFKLYAFYCFIFPVEVKEWKERLPSLLEGYAPEDILNLDETGLFFRQLPDKSLTVKAKDCAGGKKPKNRLTLVLIASAAGKMEKMTVIGK